MTQEPSDSDEPRAHQDETSFAQMIIWLVVVILLILIPVALALIVTTFSPGLD